MNEKNLADAAAKYDAVIVADPIVNVNGDVVAENGGFKVANDAVEVDGITGATLTCNGVAAMVNDGLQQYVNFFNLNK